MDDKTRPDSLPNKPPIGKPSEMAAALPQTSKEKIESCYAHAEDLLNAGLKVLSDFPNIAYHLATLGIEEVGKATLICLNMPVLRDEESDDSSIAQRHGEDHLRKLFWALWGPSFGRDIISREQVESYRDFAKSIHETRLRGLYVSLDPATKESPRDAVPREKAEKLLNLLRASLKVERLKEFKDLTPEEAANLAWFLSIREDRETMNMVFGAPSMRKLVELKHPREWLAWLKSQFDEADADAKRLAERELERDPTAPKNTETLKWKVRLRLRSSSHSIRPQPLLFWNEGIHNYKLFQGDKKTGELIVDILLPAAVPIGALWWAAWGMSRALAVALSIGSQGVFWWNVLRDPDKYYDSITDLENSAQCAVTRTPSLQINWGKNVLSQEALANASACLVGMTRLHDPEKQTFLDRYTAGIVFLTKTDVHGQFEANAFEGFCLALRDAMRHFGAWDGATNFGDALGKWFPTVFEDKEQLQKYVKLCEVAESEPQALKVTLEEVGVMKVLADLFILKHFRAEAENRLSMKRAEGPETP